MAIYNYCCDNCGYKFEELLSIEAGKERLNKACPACGEIRLRRPFATPAIHLRGYSPAHPRFFRGMRGPRPKRRGS